jgi:hypothetical protein
MPEILLFPLGALFNAGAVVVGMGGRLPPGGGVCWPNVVTVQKRAIKTGKSVLDFFMCESVCSMVLAA